MARVIFDNGCVIVGMAAFVWLVYLGMNNNPSMKPKIRRPNNRLDKEIRDSATHNKWV